MHNKELLLKSIQDSIEKINIQKEISELVNLDTKSNLIHDKILNHLNQLEEIITTKNLSENYVNQFDNDINQTVRLFPYITQTNVDFLNHTDKTVVKSNIEKSTVSLETQLEQLEFNLDFFKKLDFFSSNIVAIGANGSGKTSLSNDLKRFLPNNGVVISAQKVLIIPTFSGVSNSNSTFERLSESQNGDKSLKVTYTTENNGNAWSIMTKIGGEFKLLLDNLLAERSEIRNKYFKTLEIGTVVNELPNTNLDKALSIWNSLIQHRTLDCEDGININLTPLNNSDSYPAHQMSDGEKVTLYLIAHVLQAPKLGFIIVDEPEMYLHKTILNKLWDILEEERKDCIFVYLTHDLDFATSRINSKKIWIKSFQYPNKWEIEDIPENELPESLMLELLGSRKDILFCEGDKGGPDEKIYNILFDNLTVTPVKSCFSVMNYTKAFNKLPNVLTKAYGLIDSDHHSEQRLASLESENVFSFSFAEPENIFLDEEFLKLLSKQLFSPTVVEDIKKEVLEKLQSDIELQVSNYLSTKINYYFKDSHVSEGNNLADVKKNFGKFTSEINLDDWYEKRKAEIEDIVANKDYPRALSIFNNKGLKKIANKHLKISDFSNRAFEFLKSNKEAQRILIKKFPQKLHQNGI